jgi:hypothetical protein
LIPSLLSKSLRKFSITWDFNPKRNRAREPVRSKYLTNAQRMFHVRDMLIHYLRLVIDGKDNFCHSNFLESFDLGGTHEFSKFSSTFTENAVVIDQCNNKKPESGLFSESANYRLTSNQSHPLSPLL